LAIDPNQSIPVVTKVNALNITHIFVISLINLIETKLKVKLICDYFEYQYINQIIVFNLNLLLELNEKLSELPNINHLFTAIDYFIFLLLSFYVFPFKHLIIISVKNDSIYSKHKFFKNENYCKKGMYSRLL
jgi:hypothetical protein